MLKKQIAIAATVFAFFAVSISYGAKNHFHQEIRSVDQKPTATRNYVLIRRPLAPHECIFNLMNTETYKVFKTVVKSCDFVQTQESVTEKHVVFLKVPGILAPRECLYYEENPSTGKIRSTIVVRLCPSAEVDLEADTKAND